MQFSPIHFFPEHCNCSDCGNTFTVINDEAENEIRCVDCQTKFRIAAAIRKNNPVNWDKVSPDIIVGDTFRGNKIVAVDRGDVIVFDGKQNVWVDIYEDHR